MYIDFAAFASLISERIDGTDKIVHTELTNVVEISMKIWNVNLIDDKRNTYAHIFDIILRFYQ